MAESISVNVAVNEFVLENWSGFPRREVAVLAKWATSAQYQFRSDKEHNLLITNPANGKTAMVLREKKKGKVKYYIRIQQKQRLNKIGFTMELESFLLRSIPFSERIFPDQFANIKIKALENE